MNQRKCCLLRNVSKILRNLCREVSGGVADFIEARSQPERRQRGLVVAGGGAAVSHQRHAARQRLQRLPQQWRQGVLAVRQVLLSVEDGEQH